MRINHNIASMIGRNALDSQQAALGKSLEKLSTGLRINRAADDAAGLSVSESLRSKIRGMGRAKANAQDGIALLQIAEGAAGQVGDIIQRMRELAIQSATDTLTTVERSFTQKEFVQLLGEITRITHAANYDGMNLLDGSPGSFGTAGSASILHIGSDASAASRVPITIDSLTLVALGLSGDNDGDDDLESEPAEGEIVVSIDTASNALSALTAIDAALQSVNTMRSRMGAYVNRLGFAAENLDNQIFNTQDAESRIRDVDFASETSEFTRAQILSQSATSMLAQANQAPQGALALLGR